jgi:hypothetical protein
MLSDAQRAKIGYAAVFTHGVMFVYNVVQLLTAFSASRASMRLTAI